MFSSIFTIPFNTFFLRSELEHILRFVIFDQVWILGIFSKYRWNYALHGILVHLLLSSGFTTNSCCAVQNGIRTKYFYSYTFWTFFLNRRQIFSVVFIGVVGILGRYWYSFFAKFNFTLMVKNGLFLGNNHSCIKIGKVTQQLTSVWFSKINYTYNLVQYK